MDMKQPHAQGNDYTKFYQNCKMLFDFYLSTDKNQTANSNCK